MGLWQRIFAGKKQATPAQSNNVASQDALCDFLARPPLLEADRLFALADQHAASYAQATPFPHVMIENFLTPDAVDSLLSEFPAPGDAVTWRKVRAETESGELMQYNKLGMPHVEDMSPALQELMWELNSGTFLRFLEKLTGVSGLLADPKLRGGGLHQVLPGGVLGVHADFTNHAEYNLDRRLNVLLYLNRDWQDDYGGELELWSRDMSRCERRIRPLAGRCVVFSTSESSFHGHPRALSCPDGRSRKSVATYYYTQGRDDKEVEATQRTDWQSLPEAELPGLE
jgi:hypothetical protein